MSGCAGSLFGERVLLRWRLDGCEHLADDNPNPTLRRDTASNGVKLHGGLIRNVESLQAILSGILTPSVFMSAETTHRKRAVTGRTLSVAQTMPEPPEVRKWVGSAESRPTWGARVSAPATRRNNTLFHAKFVILMLSGASYSTGF